MIAQHFIFELHKPEVLMEAFESAATMWKKHGAKEVSLWNLRGSKINRMSFSVRCDSMEDMGKCMDALDADPDFQAWQVKYWDSSTIKENVVSRLVAEG